MVKEVERFDEQFQEGDIVELYTGVSAGTEYEYYRLEYRGEVIDYSESVLNRTYLKVRGAGDFRLYKDNEGNWVWDRRYWSQQNRSNRRNRPIIPAKIRNWKELIT